MGEELSEKIGILEPMHSESDYIYHIDRQISLEGKLYRNIRNNINKFERDYGKRAEFREFSTKDIEGIKEF